MRQSRGQACCTCFTGGVHTGGSGRLRTTAARPLRHIKTTQALTVVPVRLKMGNHHDLPYKLLGTVHLCLQCQQKLCLQWGLAAVSSAPSAPITEARRAHAEDALAQPGWAAAVPLPAAMQGVRHRLAWQHRPEVPLGAHESGVADAPFTSEPPERWPH